MKKPMHLAIIMDGNRRWARGKGLAIIAGHNYAVDKRVEELIDECGEMGIEYLTLWAFSTENWQRESREVEGIMNLFRRALVEKVDKLIDRGARLNVIGDISRFDEDIRQGIERSIERSKNNSRIVVTFALNYGGRDEIIRAIKSIIRSDISPDQINEELVDMSLDTKDLPDPDLIIRTGGSYRMSGFMPWQGVYSEYYFTDVLFPDFNRGELRKAIEEYGKRDRRFGADENKKS